jgi:uncharacterized membrane protein
MYGLNKIYGRKGTAYYSAQHISHRKISFFIDVFQDKGAFTSTTTYLSDYWWFDSRP